MSRQAELKLMRLLTKIFEDNVVTADERSELLEFQGDRELDPPSVQRVFAAFVQKKWGEVIADGRVTETEKLMLRRVLEELDLPERVLPAGVRVALR